MDRSDENAAPASEITASPVANEEPYVSPVPGCILLAIGAVMVLLLALGWLM
jgi:hypothetical protein